MIKCTENEFVRFSCTNILLVTEDKNGTKRITATCPCMRCGGTGHYSRNTMYGTVCFECGGNKTATYDFIVYTEEHAEKLRKAREARCRKKETVVEDSPVEPVVPTVPEPIIPEIITLDGGACTVSHWFKTRYGYSTRCITKPNGEKVYSSAMTNKGLAKYGLCLNPEYKKGESNGK